MIPNVPSFLTVTCSVPVSPEMCKQMDILGDDFRTRFCIQHLAWFNSGYSSCVNASDKRQCRSSTTVGVKRSRHAELLGFRQSGARCPPPRGEEYEKIGFLQTSTTFGSTAGTVHASILSRFAASTRQ